MGIFEEPRLLIVNVSNVCHAATVHTLREIFVIQDGSVVPGIRQFSDDKIFVPSSLQAPVGERPGVLLLPALSA